jgi:hypothetical protein
MDAEKSDEVACVRLSVTTGRREMWREKDKTQDRAPVDDRKMESQALKPSVRLLRSWNPGS